MAFTGFNFRTTLAPTGFPGEGAGNVYVPATANSYNAAQGWGYLTAASLASADNSSPADRRLWGWHSFTAGSVVFRVDMAPGNYLLRLAIGSQAGGAVDVKVVDGPAATGTLLKEITGTNAAGAIFDASNAARTPYTDWTANEVDIPVTVTQNYITIVKGSAANVLIRHLAYQAVTTPLGPITLDTDDTGYTYPTTATTVAGSAAVSNIPAVVVLSPGMTVTGAAVPAGTTVAATSGTLNTTGTTTAGSNTVTGIPSVIGIVAGMVATGPAIPTVGSDGKWSAPIG